jgi:phenylalanyl-tRNA synthetase beta chain
MKFSTRWIGEYVDIPESTGELAERLTAAGLAVEGVEPHEDDLILDIDVTANRPDAMNHYGVARELAAIFGRPLKALPGAGATGGTPAGETIRLEIENFADCPRYCAFVIRGVKVGPSPPWLAARLQSIGARPINNVVDVTNYVLWETGQPLHAFDLHKIRGGLIRVRRAAPGESLQTLDKELRELSPEVLVIADAEGPVGIGGVMGGFDSEVTADTVDILLESAHFYAPVARRGAKLLGMKTDASHRFERGADPGGCATAGLRAAALIAELAGGTLAPGLAELHQPLPDWPPKVDLSFRALCKFGGADIPSEDGERILRGLGFRVVRDGDAWTVTAPSWRYYDFRDPYPADVYEEVLRIWGFDKIPTTLPAIGGADGPMLHGHWLRRMTQDHLSTCGLSEAINYAFHDRARDEAYPTLRPQGAALALANPLSDRYAVMRRSLLPNLIEAARYNQRRGAGAVRLFEIGHIFWAPPEGGSEEAEAVALAIGGSVGTPWERATPLDFFDLKGILDSLLEALGVAVCFRPATLPRLVPGMTAEIVLEGPGGPTVIGYAGQLDEKEPGYPFLVAELGLEFLPKVHASLLVKAPSPYPGIEVDTTLQHALEVPWQALEDQIKAAAVPDLVRFWLKDRYRGAGVPEGAVATTIGFLYNSESASLTQDEVNDRHQALAARLAASFGLKQQEPDTEGEAR